MKVLMISSRMPLSIYSFSKIVRLGGFKAHCPPLSLITVAALLPRQWQPRLVDLNFESLTEEMWAWADLVMISGMIKQRPNMLALIREAKSRGKTVVAGGAYPSTMPEEVLEAGVDFLIKGEGENTIPRFLEGLAAVPHSLPGDLYRGGVKPSGRLNFYTNYEVVEPPASLGCYPCWDVGCKDLSVRWRSDPCRLLVRPEEVIEKFKRLVSRFPVD